MILLFTATQKEVQKFKTDYRLMQAKSIAEHSAFIKLPFVFKVFVLSIFGMPLKTGFTVIVLSFLVLQSSSWGREIWLLYLIVL